MVSRRMVPILKEYPFIGHDLFGHFGKGIRREGEVLESTDFIRLSPLFAL